jgi:hypothetical protein
MSFMTERLSLVELLLAIRSGHAWTAPHRKIRHRRPTRHNPTYQTTYRVKDNVLGSQLLALDCDTEDERSTFDWLAADPFIGHYGGVLHATASSRPERPRTRVIFVLDRPLDRAGYELALKALLERYPYCDQSACHAAVVFYGAARCDYRLIGQLLPVEVLWYQVIRPYQERRAAERQRRAAARLARQQRVGHNEAPDPAQVRRYVEAALGHIVDELATTRAGQGLRHKRLFESALKLGSLGGASWLTSEGAALLAEAEAQLLEAAQANGYVADYGETDAVRTIDAGLAIGERNPRQEPVWRQRLPLAS